MIETRDAIEAIFRPASVAVFGASEDKDKFGGRLYGALLRHEFPGTVYPINPRRDQLLGVKTYSSLQAVPGPVDVAAIALPTEAAMAALQECAERGVKAAIVISTGFAEAGPEGKVRQDQLLELVRQGGPRLLGPNCLGAINTVERTALCSTIALERVPMTSGSVSLISQSGALLGSMMSIAQDAGIGFRYLVSGGNESDLDLADFIDFFLDDPKTTVVAAFIEHIRQPARFMEAARKAQRLGKPIVALKVGRSEASAAVARSHTGALTGDDRVNDAVFRALGITRVFTPEDLVATAHALAMLPKAGGNRLAVLSASGGACGMLADLATDAGLALPQLEGAMSAGLGDLYDHAVNPLDLGGMRNPTFQPELIRATVDAIGRDPEVDMLMLGLTTMPMVDRNMEQVAQFAAAWGKPVLVYSIIGSVAANAVATLQAAGIPVFTSAVAAIGAARALVDASRADGGAAPERPAGLPDPAEARKLIGRPFDLVAAYGLTLPQSEIVTNGDAAAAFAERLNRPLAVKIETPLVPHKTEADAVRLNVTGGPATRSAFKDVNASARAWILAHDDSAELGEQPLPVLVQEMVSGVEVLIGATVDPNFGPMIAFGLGGVMVELLNDVALRPAPVSADQARGMIASVRGAKLLEGFRGAPPADVDALVDALVRASWLVTDLSAHMQELDLNPIAVLPRGQGVRVLDALVVPA